MGVGSRWHMCTRIWASVVVAAFVVALLVFATRQIERPTIQTPAIAAPEPVGPLPRARPSIWRWPERPGRSVAARSPNWPQACSTHKNWPRACSTHKPVPSVPNRYDQVEENRFRRVDNDPLSTFSIDVDTASYANIRRFITDGSLPPAAAVRIEELVNYFHFDYPQPSGHAPFSITTELTASPWNPRHKLALIGLQGREIQDREPSPRNLVFLIDVSGSMMPPDKLPLVRTAMRMLADVLTERDRVAIVVYAGASGLVLPSTSGDQKERIHQALARLEAGGSTNGASGITLAYQVARHNFIPGGVNRVVLATDGDFNVGVTSQSELVRLIEHERESGVFLSVLGVGTGNLNDSTMEKLADKGNGNYSYLDTIHEARKVLVREAGGTLDTIAKDVKIQVEFNPREVAAYRLIGTRTVCFATRTSTTTRKMRARSAPVIPSPRSTKSCRSAWRWRRPTSTHSSTSVTLDRRVRPRPMSC